VGFLASVAHAEEENVKVVAFECPLDADRNFINGTYADPDNCALYYHCNRDLRWPRQCPPGLEYWPLATGEECTFTMCVKPELSGCEPKNKARAAAKYELVREELEAHERDMAERRAAMTEDELTDYYPCYQDEKTGNWVDITLPNRQNCYQYYHCTGGISFPSECPPFSYYTPNIGWRGPGNGCQFSVCQEFEDALCAIDGNWGSWGAWGECSAPCGDGIQIRERECNDPPTTNGGTQCPGYSFEPRLCNVGTCKDNGTAVFAYRLTDISTGVTEVDPIDFEGLLVNSDGSYSIVDHTWTSPSDGLYFQGLGTGVLALQPANAYLKSAGSYPSLGVKRSHIGHLGRDGGISNQAVFFVGAGDVLNVAAAPGTSMTADAGKPSYWTIFSLEDVGGSELAFSAAFTNESAAADPLLYDTILTNEGNAYNNGVFAPQVAGYYYISYSAGVDTTTTQTSIDFVLTASGSSCDATGTFRSTLSRSHVNYEGIDTVSRGILMYLNTGCSVSMSSVNPFFSSDNLETSFSGFLYNPLLAGDSVAFFVARSNSWSDNTALDPVPFDRVAVNEGNGWGADGLDNFFVSPATGYYFVMMSAGAQNLNRVDVRLYINDEYTADIYRQSMVHQGTDFLSRNIIVHLKEGDRMRWRAVASTSLYSSSGGLETSFGGFMLFRGETSDLSEEQTDELLQQFKL